MLNTSWALRYQLAEFECEVFFTRNTEFLWKAEAKGHLGNEFILVKKKLWIKALLAVLLTTSASTFWLA